MKLTSPTNARHRFICHCFGPDGPSNHFASAVAGRHDFEVEDHVTGVIYTQCDSGNKQGQQWIWNGKEWLDMESRFGQSLLEKLKDPKKDERKAAAKKAAKPAKKADPKPANMKEWTVEDRADTVVESFKKVTKEP